MSPSSGAPPDSKPSFGLTSALVDLPRWLFLFAIVEAPWLYGSTRSWTVPIFNWLAWSIILLWLFGCLVQRRLPQIHPAAAVCCFFLILQGWFAVVNAQYFYDWAEHRFVPIDSIWRFGPGVLDRTESIPIMFRLTAVLGIFAFASDALQSRVWRKRTLWTIGLTGTSIVAVGIGREILGLKLRGTDPSKIGETSFATYFYHGNAGSYINLVLPVIAGLTILAFARGGQLQRSIWSAALLLCVAASFVAASKAAMIVTALLLLAFGLWQMPALLRATASPSRAILFVSLVLAVCLAAAIFFGWNRTASQWTGMRAFFGPDNPRLLAAQAAVTMLPDAGAWGIGAGNFGVAFPHYTNHLGDRIAGVWTHAHNDYLQAAIEWGWVGAIVWSILLFGGILVGFRNYKSLGRQMRTTDRLLLFASALALVGVALHAVVDFPLQMASLQFYAATYLGIAWGSSFWRIG
ncbi:MAG TPA: O-antigen ligase family protein [Bryobacteraceae bacterium]|nr:O-antigen ligase family protein [Bryobacteraceae bacterium]